MRVNPIRSRIMASVRQRNTTPELSVRKIIHALGFRFRLHKKGLPGTPDIVLSRLRTAIFVHGCFWHRHGGCPKATTPLTRRGFWLDKFETNVRRDETNIAALQKLGWNVLVVWECETRHPTGLRSRLQRSLSGKKGRTPRSASSLIKRGSNA
jgi:DNA mismatch endonuclease (patch repair protein)